MREDFYTKPINNTLFLLFIMGILGGMFSCSEQKEVFDPPKKPGELGKATLYLTTGDQNKLLSREPDLARTEMDNSTLPTINIDVNDLKQEMEGFGAALTGSSAYVLNQKMSSGQRQVLLEDLFSTNGISLSYARMTIGASDFSLSDYTYNDLAPNEVDYELKNFSIANDKQDVVPVFKEILTLNPDLHIMGSPWSPPAWMKTNNSLIGGELKKEAYGVYADYFVRFIEAFREEEIPIKAITVQNEHLHANAGYPCMLMSSQDQNTFIRDYLGPVFEERGLNTQIILYDHNWDNTQYAISILNDPMTKKYVVGSAFHGYAGDVNAMSLVHNAHPDRGLYFTEISGGGWATNFSDNLQWNMRNVFMGTTNNWSKNVLLWNLALDENMGPTNNGCQDCRGVVTINSQTGEVTKNVEYYALGHFSKFIPSGSQRVGNHSSGDLSGLVFVSFIRPDGGKVLVISNDSIAGRELKVTESQSQIIYTIPAKSVATLTWD